MSAYNKVMFVDDEEGVRTSWDRMLSDYGFDVTTAEDGTKAVRELRDHPVDVVVSDLKMPGLDGIQLLEWIHARRPDTRFILLTGYGNEEVEQRVRELGAFEYLNKPISPETLAAVVTAAMHLNPQQVLTAAPAVETVEAEEVEAEATVEAAPEPEPVVRKSRLRAAFEILGGLIVAPLLGLAFVMFLPVIGFGALFWMLGETVWDAFKPATT
ncbi:MAG: response regulator [Gemmatimonadetes bacterium]|nr:response regulator [Gemmatimonadota bacterium]